MTASAPPLFCRSSVGVTTLRRDAHRATSPGSRTHREIGRDTRFGGGRCFRRIEGRVVRVTRRALAVSSGSMRAIDVGDPARTASDAAPHRDAVRRAWSRCRDDPAPTRRQSPLLAHGALLGCGDVCAGCASLMSSWAYPGCAPRGDELRVVGTQLQRQGAGFELVGNECVELRGPPRPRSRPGRGEHVVDRLDLLDLGDERGIGTITLSSAPPGMSRLQETRRDETS